MFVYVLFLLRCLQLNTAMLGVAIYMMCKHARATAAWKMKQKTRLESIR